MEEKLIIRRARTEECAALAGIEAICFPPEEAASGASIAQRLSVFPEWFFVAELEDGTLCGMVNGMATDAPCIADEMFADAHLHKPDGRVQTIFGLDVLPEYRGKGVAHALMDAFADAAKKAGREKVTLTCKKRLIGMYEHFGYVLCGESGSEHGGAKWYDMDKTLG